MVRLIRRSALALLAIITGLTLLAVGVSVGIVVFAIGALALLSVNLFAPWPWQQAWHDWPDKSDAGGS